MVKNVVEVYGMRKLRYTVQERVAWNELNDCCCRRRFMEIYSVKVGKTYKSGEKMRKAENKG